MIVAEKDRLEREDEGRAVQAIMYVKAANEKKVSVDSLTGKDERKKNESKNGGNGGERRRVTPEEKQTELQSLRNTLGEAVIN